jgi:hypothetical protein
MTADRSKTPFKPLYPDVLGQITGGQRINMEGLEVALGVYPKMAYVNQPFEVVIVLQNMIDDELRLKIAIRAPSIDRQGNVMIIEIAKPQMAFSIGPGEVGVLRMPVIANPPTKPENDIPLRVAIRYRTNSDNYIRPPGGGAPPSVLTVSPFKLQVLREIDFIAHKWNESTDILTVNFDIAPKHFPGNPPPMKPSYETLWTQEGMQKEIRLALSYYDEALELAKPAATGQLYVSFLDAVEERFAKRGLPLHPGETKAIAKMMAYTVEDAPTREPGVVLENTRWFRALCQVLASDPSMIEIDRHHLISHYVFDAVIYEAILVAFKIAASRVKEDLGSKEERFNYANRFMKWFSGYGDPDLTFIYLPLILGGVSIARSVRSGYGESPWQLYDELVEAYNGRIRLISNEAVVVFDMLAELLDKYKVILQSQRIERPH